MTDPLVSRLAAVRSGIDAAAVAAGRSPADVRLLLATKTVPAVQVLTALRAGYRLIGENRVQEVVGKAGELADEEHSTHFIGHLQTNKLNSLLPHLDCLQTLDSVELAERLQRKLTESGRTLEVFVQVNVTGEDTKSGVSPAAVPALLAGLAGCDRLTVRGYMTIGLNSPDRGAVRAGYRALAELRDTALVGGMPGAEAATELSMGMSADYPDAIAEGATMVRLGSAVFGART